MFFWSPRLHIDSVSNPPVTESIAVNGACWSSLLMREVFTHGALCLLCSAHFRVTRLRNQDRRCLTMISNHRYGKLRNGRWSSGRVTAIAPLVRRRCQSLFHVSPDPLRLFLLSCCRNTKCPASSSGSSVRSSSGWSVPRWKNRTTTCSTTRTLLDGGRRHPSTGS